MFLFLLTTQRDVQAVLHKLEPGPRALLDDSCFLKKTRYPLCVGTQLEAENEVNNEMANRMSLFYAEATPMLKTLSNATTKFVSEVDLQFFPRQIHTPSPLSELESRFNYFRFFGFFFFVVV